MLAKKVMLADTNYNGCLFLELALVINILVSVIIYTLMALEEEFTMII